MSPAKEWLSNGKGSTFPDEAELVFLNPSSARTLALARGKAETLLAQIEEWQSNQSWTGKDKDISLYGAIYELMLRSTATMRAVDDDAARTLLAVIFGRHVDLELDVATQESQATPVTIENMIDRLQNIADMQLRDAELACGDPVSAAPHERVIQMTDPNAKGTRYQQMVREEAQQIAAYTKSQTDAGHATSAIHVTKEREIYARDVAAELNKTTAGDAVITLGLSLTTIGAAPVTPTLKHAQIIAKRVREMMNELDLKAQDQGVDPARLLRAALAHLQTQAAGAPPHPLAVAGEAPPADRPPMSAVFKQADPATMAFVRKQFHDGEYVALYAIAASAVMHAHGVEVHDAVNGLFPAVELLPLEKQVELAEHSSRLITAGASHIEEHLVTTLNGNMGDPEMKDEIAPPSAKGGLRVARDFAWHMKGLKFYKDRGEERRLEISGGEDNLPQSNPSVPRKGQRAVPSGLHAFRHFQNWQDASKAELPANQAPWQ